MLGRDVRLQNRVQPFSKFVRRGVDLGYDRSQWISFLVRLYVSIGVPRGKLTDNLAEMDTSDDCICGID